jgi:hypothetical protein
LSESLSLFFPRHTVHSAARRINKRLLTLVPHTTRVSFQDTTKTRPVHKLDTERTWCGKPNECASSAVGMECASIYSQKQTQK